MSFRTVIGGLALAGLALVGAGCGDDKQTVEASSTTKTDNGQKMRFFGQVRNKQTFGALANATVEICGIGSGTTDSQGNFLFEVSGNITATFNNSFIPDSDGTSFYTDDATTVFAVKVTCPGNAPQFFTITINNDEPSNNPANFPGNVQPAVTDATTDPGANSTSVYEIGTVLLNTGFTETILVEKDGQPLGGVLVSIIGNFPDTAPVVFSSENEDSGPNFLGFEACHDVQTQRTGSNGIATFSDLDPFRGYEVIVAGQDTTGDGVPDFGTFDDGFSVGDTGGATTIRVDGTRFFDTTVNIEDIGATEFDTSFGTETSFNFARGPIANTTTAVFETDGTPSLGDFDFADDDIRGDTTVDRGIPSDVDQSNVGETQANFVLSGDGSVNIFFDSPTRVLQGSTGQFDVHFTYVDNMKDPRQAGFNLLKRVPGTASGSIQNLMWTFHPSTPIPAYTPYSIDFDAVSDVANNDNGFPTAHYSTQDFGSYMRVENKGGGGIDISLDNYNGSRSISTTATVISTDVVRLEFDRIVVGQYRVSEFTSDNVLSTLPQGGSFRSIDSGSATLVRNIDTAPSTGDVKELGSRSGFRYHVPLLLPNGNTLLLGDNTGALRNTVRISFNVEDIQGNKVQEIRTLNVE